MKTEFNLSEKEQALGTLAGATYGTKIYYPEDVKEFIRLLKEEINENAFGELININNRIIDTLAGDKLR